MNLSALDHEAFGALIEPHRRELYVHCYRMLGAVQDAEDMVQETFLRAWRRRETFAGRATVRAWLYKIATNACLDALEKRGKRFVPVTRGTASTLEQPIPTGIDEPVWLEPFADEWLAADEHEPAEAYARREHITLAFITALHLLSPRQRAVLILRDVLEWEASEVAVLLDTSVSAVKSALHRARETVNGSQRANHEGAAPHVIDSARQRQLAAYVQAWETANVEGLLALLREDVTFSMPPIPAWYQGRATVGGLVSKTVFAGSARGRWRLLPTRANGQLAFGLYRRDEGQGCYSGYGIQVLTFGADGLIADMITFRVPALVPRFRLPERFPL